MITVLFCFLTYAVGYFTGFIVSDLNRRQGFKPTISDIRKWIAESEFSSSDEMHHPNKG
jgi:hypothetical protein